MGENEKKNGKLRERMEKEWMKRKEEIRERREKEQYCDKKWRHEKRNWRIEVSITDAYWIKKKEKKGKYNSSLFRLLSWKGKRLIIIKKKIGKNL